MILKLFFEYSTAGPALIRFYIAEGVKMHYIFASDTEFHTHPWDAQSYIFGWYDEEIAYMTGVKPIKERRWFVNQVFAYVPHKVTILFPVWTLFIHEKRINPNWNYGTEVRPWEGSDQEREIL